MAREGACNMTQRFSSLVLFSELMPYRREGLTVLASDGEEGESERAAFIQRNDKFLPGLTPEYLQRSAQTFLSGKATMEAMESTAVCPSCKQEFVTLTR